VSRFEEEQMTRIERAAGTGARAPAHRLSTTRWLVAVLATLIALAGLAVLPASPAAADDHLQNEVVNLVLDCQAITPIGPVAAEFPLTVSSTYPGEIQRGQTGQIVLQQGVIDVPEELDAGDISAVINNVKNTVVRFKAPTGFKVLSVQSVGGQDGFGAPIASSATYAQATGIISWSIPGPFVPAQSPITPPDLIVEVQATGSAGTVGQLLIDSFTTTSNVNIGITLDLAVSCPTPDPNPPLTSITILPGAYVPEYEPTATLTELSGQCQVRYPSRLLILPPGANVNFDLNDVPFFVSGVRDVPPGEQVTVTVDLGAYDWIGQIPAGIALGEPAHIAVGIRNWRVDIAPPQGFSVVGVSTGTGMTASLMTTGGQQHIRWARPTGAAGEFGPGLWTPPAPLQVTLQATSGAGHVGDFRLFGSLSTAGVNSTTSTPGLEWVTRRQENLGQTVADATTRCSHTTARWNYVNHLRSLGTLGVESPPVAVDDELTANNAFPTSLAVTSNDLPGSAGDPLSHAEVVTEPTHGTALPDPANPDRIIYTPTWNSGAATDSFTYVVLDTAGRVSNVATVTLDLSEGAFCHSAPCSLNQFIEFTVHGDPLTMEQAGSDITLQTITLHGEPQNTNGVINELTIVNRRGDGQHWSVTGQVTDFKTGGLGPDCPASSQATWRYTCIPGDNLGWQPLAHVEHDRVPGDVAVVAPGSSITSGLSSVARSLCTTTAAATKSGGTFVCGAGLTLRTPASAAADTYTATLTLTLA
jgi:hypothetical protein